MFLLHVYESCFHAPRIGQAPPSGRRTDMHVTYLAANALSIIMFLGTGVISLRFNGMVEEFRRYGLDRYRRLVGSLEVAGAIGLCVGFAFRPLAVLSASGLSLLMFFAVLARMRARDAVLQTLPALALMLVNVFIAISALDGPPR